MKESQALEQMKLYLLVLQKYRSSVAEELPAIPQETLAGLSKWIFGENAEPFLIALSDVIDSGTMTTMQYYNFRTILWKWTPEVIYVASVLRLNPDGIALPSKEPNMFSLIDGWSDE